jgi:hypothetical protein
MSTTQTDSTWEYQDQVRHAFLSIVTEDIEEAQQWLLDAEGDERIIKETIHWCKDYLNTYMEEFKSWTEAELIKNKKAI